MTYTELEEVLRRGMNNWVDGVSISGGEPTMQRELPETLRFIKNLGFDIKLDTQGSLPNALKEALPFCDYVAMDYKMPIDQYSIVAGVPVNGKAVKESLRLLRESGVSFEMRTTVIPGIHEESHIREMCSQLPGVETFVLQKFSPRENLSDVKLREIPQTDVATMNQYGDIAREFFPNVIIR